MKTSDLFMQKRQKGPKTLFANKPRLYLPAFSKLNMLKTWNSSGSNAKSRPSLFLKHGIESKQITHESQNTVFQLA